MRSPTPVSIGSEMPSMNERQSRRDRERRLLRNRDRSSLKDKRSNRQRQREIFAEIREDNMRR